MFAIKYFSIVRYISIILIDFLKRRSSILYHSLSSLFILSLSFLSLDSFVVYYSRVISLRVILRLILTAAKSFIAIISFKRLMKRIIL